MIDRYTRRECFTLHRAFRAISDRAEVLINLSSRADPEINKYQGQGRPTELDVETKRDTKYMADLAKRVMEKAGYTAQELAEEMEKRKAEYDMLTDEGALTLIANELGVVELPEEPPTTRIGDLKAGMQDLDVVGKVVRINPPREFTRRDGSTGCVCSLVLADKTGSVRVTLWDRECRLLEEVEEQDVLKVLGGVCRSGLRGCEIHTARRARFVPNPSVAEDPRVGDLDSVASVVEAPALRKRIPDLGDGDANVEIRGTLVRLYRVWTYDACPKCGRKVSEGLCGVCGVVEPVRRAILDLGIDDSAGFMRAKLFGEVAEQLLGVKASEIGCALDLMIERGMERRRASEEYLNRKHADLLGRELVLRGRVGIDEYLGMVMSVDDVRDPDPVEEARMVLREVGLGLGR